MKICFKKNKTKQNDPPPPKKKNSKKMFPMAWVEPLTFDVSGQHVIYCAQQLVLNRIIEFIMLIELPVMGEWQICIQIPHNTHG